MYKIKVYLESLGPDVPLEAWTDGEEWNGWATPYFEYSVGLDLVTQYNRRAGHTPPPAWYDAVADEFCFILDGEVDPECYGAVTLPGEGHPARLYPIGARNWIWDVWEADNGDQPSLRMTER